MLETLLQLDQKIAHVVNQTLSNEILSLFFPIITDIHKNIFFSIPAACLILYFLIKKYGKLGIIHFFCFACSIGLSDFTGSIIKKQFNRPRPFTQHELKIEQRSPAQPKKSFYSNHSSNSFAIANYLSFVFPPGKTIYFALATTIAYSRVYNGVHYPSDILAGALMGLLISYLFYQLAQYLKKYTVQSKGKKI
ncbi:MAG: phosphatase PAP2 family protein [Pseudobdellovibrio sp.]